jgi:uncharacterized protein YndB with AHSA1/START domain
VSTGGAVDSSADPVVKEIYIEAPPSTIFEFFVDADKVCRWLALEARLDPRPGGACIQVHDGVERGGGRCEMLGTFVAVDPPTYVSFTWGFADPAVRVPPGASVVEVTLEQVGSGTTVRLVHRNLPPDEVVNHDHGWTKMLVRLAGAVEQRDSRLNAKRAD